MPSYKTHSIHGEILLPEMDKKIEIDLEIFKSFCMGPDSLICSDYKTFNNQHSSNTSLFFNYMINYIKNNKLYNNSEVMAFLYAQLDHFILDITMHPFIYYMTENAFNNYKINLHSLVEMWLDKYFSLKYNKKQFDYYKKISFLDNELKQLVNDLYSKVYNISDEYIKYQKGMLYLKLFDTYIRHNNTLKPIVEIFNIGDILYNNNLEDVFPFLNVSNKFWLNPETGEKSADSLFDLWHKSLVNSLETIEDVNNYIYNDKPLINAYINDDLSYDTGLPCKNKQTYFYIKRK